MHLHTEVAVVGAGVVGLVAGFRLAVEGHDVLSIDAGILPLPTSAGNAGTIAPYGCVPVGSPGVLRALPQLLIRRDSPFAMRWPALPSLSPWLFRFLRESMPRRAHANAAALAGLLRESLTGWQELATVTGAADLLRQSGCLYVFPDHSAFAASEWDRAQRDAGGVRQFVVSSAEIKALEPRLSDGAGPGVFFPDAAHIVDPAEMLSRLRASALARGMRTHACRIDQLRLTPGGVRLTGAGTTIDADRVVISAGAWSRSLSRQAGDRIPLETERGYHVEYGMDTAPLSRPVCAVRYGVYLTPMEGRLRAAGTVELGGLRRGPTPRRLALVDRAAHSLLEGLPAPRSEWIGFRPSLPDSLPVIGRARHSDRIVYAFGHGHLGLTLAAVTARHVADLLAGREERQPPAACSPQRFG